MWTNNYSVFRRALLLLMLVPIAAGALLSPAASARTPALDRAAAESPGAQLAGPLALPTPAPAADPAGIWTPASPLGGPPTVYGIAMDGPATQIGTTIAVATDNGVYISTNGGASWNDWSDGLLSRSATAVVRSATGAFYVRAGSLVYRRALGDALWSNYSPGLPSGIGAKLAISTDGDGTLFAFSPGTSSGSIYKRGPTDSSWSYFGNGLPSSYLATLAVSAAGVYVGFAKDVFASPLSSASWTSIRSEGSTPGPRDLPLASNSLKVLAVAPDRRLYAGLSASPSTSTGGVWRTIACPSNPAGRCWEPYNGTPPSPGFCPGCGSYLGGSSIEQLAITQANEIFAATQLGLYLKRTDEAPATNWFASGSALGIVVPSPQAGTTSGDRVVFFGSQNGILRSLDLGNNATLVNDGLRLSTAIHTMRFTDDHTFFAASDKFAYRSTDAGANWTTVYQQVTYPIVNLEPSANYSQDGSVFVGETTVAPTPPQALNAIAPASIYTSSLALSVDRGATWTATAPPGFRGQRPDALLASSTFGQAGQFFAAEFGQVPTDTSVLRSTDRGATWSAINAGLENRTIHALAVAPSAADTPLLLAGADTGVFSFDPLSVSWAGFNAGQSIGSIRQIAYSPNYRSDRALFLLGDGGLYRYQPGAVPRWKRLPATNLNVPDVKMLRVSPNFAADAVLFAQTDQDVWISRDGGGTWDPVSRLGLPDAGLLALAISPDFVDDRTVFVSTNGQGIFKYILPPPAPPWLVLLYLGGQDHGGDQSLDESLRLMLGRLGPLPNNPAVRIVALYDGNQAGDSAIFVKDGQAGGLRQVEDLPPALASKELDTGRVSTLQAFIRWARETYPGARYTMLSIIDHGGGWAPDFDVPSQHESEAGIEAGGWRGMSLDVSGPDQVTSLSTKETGLALKDLGPLGHFDIVFFDACLMGMIESAYEIQPYTHYFIAGENLLWSNLPYDKYLASTVVVNGADKGLKAQTTPDKLAANIIDLHDAFTPYDPTTPHNQPFTIAALDMHKLPALKDQINTLAGLLWQQLHDDPSDLAFDAITQAYMHTQKFDYDASLSLDPNDGYVDLVDFADRLIQDSTLSSVHPAASAIKTIVTDPQGPAVIGIKKRSGMPKLGTGLWNFDGAHGISIYLPLGQRDCRPSGPIGGQDDDPQCQYPGISGTAERPALEWQLKYYTDTEQLAFTRDAPNWPKLVAELDARRATKLGSSYIRNLDAHPFRSPAMLRTQWHRYLPSISNGRPAGAAGTDLVVIGPLQVLPANPQAGQPAEIRVTIKNIGTADITKPFWVDFYVDPREIPRPNRVWPDISQYGAAWRVYSLGAGDSITLSTKHPDDPHDPGARYSNFTGFVQSGAHQLYALADSFAEGQGYGALDEDNEANNGYGPQTVVVAGTAAAQVSAPPDVDSRSGK